MALSIFSYSTMPPSHAGLTFDASCELQARGEFAKNIIHKEDNFYIETPDGIIKISMEEELI